MSDGRAPVRIQRKRTKGWRMPPDAVYVGRPTYWGNPFVWPRAGGVVFDRNLSDVYVVDRESSVRAYRDYLNRKVGYSGFSMAYEALCELRGKDLACWCPLDVPCHADVLLEVANS